MNISKIEKDEISAVSDRMSKECIGHPLFMYYCPNKSKRANFINVFFTHYLDKWKKNGTAFYSKDKRAVASLIDRNDFEFGFSGKKALKLSLISDKKRIFAHREIVLGIVGILVPDSMNAKVLNLYCDSSCHKDSALKLVKEAMKLAKKEDFVLVYETFSRRFIPDMEKLGFTVGFQRNFIGTQYVQTLMTYNTKK